MKKQINIKNGQLFKYYHAIEAPFNDFSVCRAPIFHHDDLSFSYNAIFIREAFDLLQYNLEDIEKLCPKCLHIILNK